MDLRVVYDPDIELAAIVDLDNKMGWGPTMVGPGARDLLEAWLVTVPYDMSELNPAVARDWFAQFLEASARGVAESIAEDSQLAAQPDGNSGVAAVAQAEQEASAVAGSPPEPQPADTDMAADQGAQVALVDCPVCEANGWIMQGDPPARVVCGFCEGRRQIEQVIA